VDLGDHALVGGVDDVEGLAFLALDELVVDEPGWVVSEGCSSGCVDRLEGYRWRFFDLRERYLQASRLLVLAGVRRLKLDGSHIEVMCLVWLIGVANRNQWHNRVCLAEGEEKEI
jgi:hypothetical protein